MPGFIGGSSGGSGGTGGEITFPKEFIDPVTKLRVSQPENLIDTDFEYGLQPTKWETVELINNTPSFFSKSGDTTIPGIISITTNAGTREITVRTGLEHQLAVGIPINVTGTKSVTADGAYIINSIPNATTFTYLCKDNQTGNNSIEDLYTSIITGEFFQGSQLRIADGDGIITDGEAISTLTVTTESTHGFGVNTPFYFLNLNSTISQEFQAANTAAKSFDSSNSATAQTFDGSNTLTQIQIDFSNSAVAGGTPSAIVSVDTSADTITVTHTSESFAGSRVGQPLYHDVTTSAGYFSTNPRGVVFLKTTDQLASGTSIFQVSLTPDGDAIDLQASMAGTFQIANQARGFAGNNLNEDTQEEVTLFEETALVFDGANDTGKLATVQSYASGGIILLTNDEGSEASLSWAVGQMVRYETSGSAASGLVNNETYWVKSVNILSVASPGLVNITVASTPDGNAISVISGGTGTQKFRAIGIALDKDIFCLPNHDFLVGDMLKYNYPETGNITTTPSTDQKDYYYVERVYDTFNFQLGVIKGGVPPFNGSTADLAAPSATYLMTTFGITTSGYYWIKPTGWTGAARYMYCDMTTDGGAWMLLGWTSANNGAHTYIGDANTWADTGGTANGGVSTFGALPNISGSRGHGQPFIDSMVTNYRTSGFVMGWYIGNNAAKYYFNPNSTARWLTENSNGNGRNGTFTSNHGVAGNQWLKSCRNAYSTSGQNGAGSASGGTAISWGGSTWGVFPYNMSNNWSPNWGSAITSNYLSSNSRGTYPSAHQDGWGQASTYWIKLSDEA